MRTEPKRSFGENGEQSSGDSWYGVEIQGMPPLAEDTQQDFFMSYGNIAEITPLPNKVIVRYYTL